MSGAITIYYGTDPQNAESSNDFFFEITMQVTENTAPAVR